MVFFTYFTKHHDRLHAEAALRIQLSFIKTDIRDFQTEDANYYFLENNKMLPILNVMGYFLKMNKNLS